MPNIYTYAWFDPLEGLPPCTKDGWYIHLWLTNNKLSGTLPDELYWLTTLRTFDTQTDQTAPSFELCSMTGSLSTHVGRMTNLERLSFANCRLKGTIPTEVGLLTKLSILYFGAGNPQWSMELHGTIPTEIGQLMVLEQATFNNCDLSGTIPIQIGHLYSSLSILGLPGNHFSGPIPSEFGMLSW